MEFEWDENKNKSNQLKHGISFEEATKIFDDEERVEYQDLRKDYGEDRWKTIGQILGIIFSVTYTLRAVMIRLISARLASQKERDLYNNQ
ncbi:MAG: BrnT family toxin [Saprospiraceae bacterium]|nr:BrnT family toxin [Saprospiraceae bacterium]